MPKQRYTTAEIVHKLREADVLIGQGRTVADATKQIGNPDKTYFRWRKTHGGLRIDQAKQLRELEAENARLKKAMAHRLGINEVMAEVLPQQKAQKIKDLQGQGRIVTMAGDGINDAPALAQAQVSASLWALERMWPWRARMSRSSKSICPASCGRALSCIRIIAQPHRCRGSHEHEFGIHHRRRIAVAPRDLTSTHTR